MTNGYPDLDTEVGGEPSGSPGRRRPEVTTVDLPGGRKQDYEWREGEEFNPKTNKMEPYAGWVAIGSPYYPKEQPGITPGQAADDALAREKFEYEKKHDADLAALRDEERKAEREENEAKRKADAAERAENRAEAEKWRQIEYDARDRRYAAQDKQTEIDNTYRERQAQQRTEEFQTSQTGYMGGVPTLSREEFELRRRESEERRANEPGNYFNIAFRSRGMEPPGQPGAVAGEPQGQRPWWENYSLQRLERFPDEELATLPPEILAKFRNEFLLSRPALMAMLSPERIRGEGQWGGTGFAEDVIAKHGVGAPVPPMAKAKPLDTGPSPETAAIPPSTFTPGQTLPIGGVGATITMPGTKPAVVQSNPAVNGQYPGGVVQSTILNPAASGFQAPGPTEQDAIAELDRIRAGR